jgi:hypothetical protein
MRGTRESCFEDKVDLAESSRDQSHVKRVIKGTNAFSHFSKSNLHIMLDEDIILKNISPGQVNSRGCVGLNRKDP